MEEWRSVEPIVFFTFIFDCVPLWLSVTAISFTTLVCIRYRFYIRIGLPLYNRAHERNDVAKRCRAPAPYRAPILVVCAQSPRRACAIKAPPAFDRNLTRNRTNTEARAYTMTHFLDPLYIGGKVGREKGKGEE